MLPDGTYKPYVKLLRSHRTIAIPSPIILDTKPPVITVKHPIYPVISPDGDGHADVVRVPYRVNEPAHAILRVGSEQVVLTYRKPLRGTLTWTGKLGRPPRPAKPGRYVLYVSAVDVAGNVSKPYPFAIVQVRYVVLARSTRHRRARAPVRDPRLDRCARRALGAARPVGHRQERDAALPRPADAGYLPAVRLRVGPRCEDPGGGAMSRRLGGGSQLAEVPALPALERSMSPDVARVGGAVGAVGLALLFVASRRDLRIAGLVAWAVGCGILATYLAPHGHHRLFAAAVVLGLVVCVAGAWLVLRVPWLLAVATLACVPARIPVHVGSTQANLLLPIYGVVVVAAMALAWELYGEEPRSRELGPLAWPLAAFVGWEGL